MPGNFISEGQRMEFDSVTLWSSEEKTWHVNFYLNRSSKQIILGAGWGDFVKDNNLKIGNVCVLEQIKKPGISFRVVIYRYLEESNPSKFPGNLKLYLPWCFNMHIAFLIFISFFLKKLTIL